MRASLCIDVHRGKSNLSRATAWPKHLHIVQDRTLVADPLHFRQASSFSHFWLINVFSSNFFDNRPATCLNNKSLHITGWAELQVHGNKQRSNGMPVCNKHIPSKWLTHRKKRAATATSNKEPLCFVMHSKNSELSDDLLFDLVWLSFQVFLFHLQCLLFPQCQDSTWSV